MAPLLLDMRRMGTSKNTESNSRSPRAELKTAYTASILAGISLSFSTAALKSWPGFICVIAFGCGAIGLLVVLTWSFIKGLMHWRDSFLSWMGPVALCVGFLLLFPLYAAIGSKIVDWKLKAHLQQYTLIVDEIRSGKLPAAQTFSDIDLKPLPPGVINIMAIRKSDGSVLVVFLTGGACPPYHVGYVFDGSGTNKECIADFAAFGDKFGLRKESGGWYYFSG
jgi:hypothetical protein